MSGPMASENDTPLHPRVLAVLLALARGPLHGYALLKRLELESDLGPRPGPTTLYRTLHELEDGGLLEATDDRPEAGLDDERRRYFQLTDRGRAVLVKEVARLERVITRARTGPLAEAGP